VTVITAFTIQTFFTIIGFSLIFNDDLLLGVTQMFTCPQILFILLFQVLTLEVRNNLCHVLSKLVLRKYADLIEWYIDIEERLAFEEYEDIN